MGPGGFMYREVYRDPDRDFAFEATNQQLEGYLAEESRPFPLATSTGAGRGASFV